MLDNLRKLLRGVPGKVASTAWKPCFGRPGPDGQAAGGYSRLCCTEGRRLKSAQSLVGAHPRQGRDRASTILREPGTRRYDPGLCEISASFSAALTEGREYFATEFVDYRSVDGLFANIAVWFIGPHQIFRHVRFQSLERAQEGPASFMADRPDLRAEEKALFATPEGAFPPASKQVLAAVRERVDLDYFGIDFGSARRPDGLVRSQCDDEFLLDPAQRLFRPAFAPACRRHEPLASYWAAPDSTEVAAASFFREMPR